MKKTNNQIVTIRVYQKHWNKTIFSWVFDDETVGLKAEALVAGADVMVSNMLGLIQQTDPTRDDVIIEFSKDPFPTSKFKVDYVGGSIESGTDYYSEDFQQPLWLCPALGCYFDESPKELYINFK